MPAISVMIKPSSGMCNMNCDYCFYCDETQKRTQENYGFMSEQTLKNIIRKTILQAEGFVSYAYQGGEPLLRGLDFFQKAIAYQQQYNKHNLKVMNALQTNGYALDEEWCSFLKENGFLVGVSVDGTEWIHNKHRQDKAGMGTHKRIMEKIALLDRYQVDYNILTVVNRDVAENIEEVYTFYKEKGWHYQQYIACLDPLEDEHGTSEYALLPEQYGKFLIRLFDLWYEDWKVGKQPNIRQFENYLGILMGYQPEACDQRGVCGIQNVVEADGSVYPCDFYMLDEYRLGNFNENRLDEINQKREEIGFRERSMNLSKECMACKYYKICRGGCRRNRDYEPAAGTYHNYFCKSYQMFFDACMERMQEMAEKVGKG